jgi:sensor histidine kinase YesM
MPLVTSRSLIILLICHLPFALIGQFSIPLHYTVKDGLPSSTVYATVQDSKGFIWIGTEGGLVRFDGAQFKVFTTQEGLPDNEVLGLFFDERTDRLWVTTYSKQPSYYRNGRIYNVQNDSSLKMIKCTYGEFIHANKSKGRVFLYNGPNLYDCSNDSIKVLENVLKRLFIYQAISWDNKTYDLLDEEGIERCGVGMRTYNYGTGHADFSEYGTWIDSLLVRFYIGKMIFYKKLPSGGYAELAHVKLDPGNQVNVIIPVDDGYVFCINGRGLFSLDRSFSSVKMLWSAANINSVFSDKQGNLWAATGDDGVYVLRKQMATNYSAENGLAHDNVTALFINKGGELLMGNTNGEIYSLQNGVLEKNELGPMVQEKVRGIAVCNNTLAIISRVFSFIDRPTKTLIPYKTTSGAPKSILLLRGGQEVLVGLVTSLINYNSVNREFSESILFKRLIAAAQHPDSRIFCGSLDGLYLYKERLTLVHVESTDPLLNSRITTMCFTDDSLLWIGTPSNGVVVYDGTKVIGHITTAKYMGYHGAICRRVIAGKKNEVWVATNGGISKIKYSFSDSLVIDNITPINTTDGLLSDDVNDVAVADSIVYVATSHGLTILNENELIAASSVPIYVSSIRINDRDSVIHDDEYHLNYLQNNLKIEYVGVSPPSSGYLRYQYRLLGAGSDRWQTTTNSSIEFRSLSPGSYIFEAVVLDKFGNKSQSVARVRFQITPAFYMTIWFWALVMVLVLATGFFIIRARFRRQQMRFEKEQGLNNKIIELEQQALKAQMNPHFIFNCLTSVQHFVNKEDLYSANMYLSNFAKLIRKTLDLSGEQYISLDKEVAYLQNYVQLEKMRFQEKFQYTIKVDEDIDEFAVMIPPMLLQPIIENAIRHGLRNMETDTGLLTISFKHEGTKLVCVIDDNGVGMRKAKELKTRMHIEYQSKGMSLTTSRIQAINMMSDKKITIEFKDKFENGFAAGTTVVLTFEQ